MTLALKFLNADAVGPYSGFEWPKPTGKRLGKWVKADGPLVLCENGIHACTPSQAPRWFRAEAWLVELDGRLVADEEKLVARRGRLVRRLDWDRGRMVGWAADCAERVLPVFEAARPGDDRPRKAIEAARRNSYAAYAADTAYAAAADAAYAAYAADAAYAAADAAAYAAYAADAAYAAADAARAAAVAAYAAYATNAAADAARAAADADAAAAARAYAAARAAASGERDWQDVRLLDLLGVTEDERVRMEGL